MELEDGCFLVIKCKSHRIYNMKHTDNIYLLGSCLSTAKILKPKISEFAGCNPAANKMACIHFTRLCLLSTFLRGSNDSFLRMLILASSAVKIRRKCFAV